MMQILRTLMWVLIAVIVFGFVSMNWGALQEVKIWPGETSGIVFDWPVGFIALVFFLLGFVPMWMFYRGVKWRFGRRIQSLENAARTVAATPIAVQEPEVEAETVSPEPDPLPSVEEVAPPAPEAPAAPAAPELKPVDTPPTEEAETGTPTSEGNKEEKPS